MRRSRCRPAGATSTHGGAVGLRPLPSLAVSLPCHRYLPLMSALPIKLHLSTCFLQTRGSGEWAEGPHPSSCTVTSFRHREAVCVACSGCCIRQRRVGGYAQALTAPSSGAASPSPRSRRQQIQRLPRTRLLVHRWPPSRCVLKRRKGTLWVSFIRALSPFSSYGPTS